MEPRRASSLSDVSDLNQTVSANKRDDLCSQCIRISRHCVGKATRPYKASPEELLDYIRLIFADVFELKGEREILEQAEGIPLPNLKLCVRILQAEGLYTAETELVGLDTYGLLWVDELRKVKTSVQRRTATPRWNEDILVEVNDWTKGSLTVEVWKKDPHSIANSLRSFVYFSSYRECLRALRSVLQTLCRQKNDNLIAEWFEWAQKPALTWIERFVDGDTMMPVNATDKIGSSARDTSTTIQEQFMVLWKNLNWPNPSVATKFALIVSACALLFTQKTEEKVKRQKYFEVIGDYGVSTRLCVAINNITAIVNCLEAIQRSIVECFHRDPQYDDVLADLCAPVQKAADSIATSVLRLTDGVLLKIEPEITRLVENIHRVITKLESEKGPKTPVMH
ncbi:hypothetical protein IscW_ISCW012316 [Ixodes scapularis]|uniref:C2 domain-containing protein n=1 Tax=Ixodes scapularis TaxID=6945 RepID=B7QFR9_IXOSC|nr:hypothetical protein IscW_ISCW012316 [Ixodes scapularis]|eukprot:XP_002414383.1 hypothetical protein IscW_ISCW012316 [Ixodes scapularis]